MKNIKIILISLLIIPLASVSQENKNKEDKTEGFEGRAITNAVWMPTAYTLNKAEFKVGIGPFAFSPAKNFQIETNLLQFLLQYYNFDIKGSFYTAPKLAIAGGLKFGYVNNFTWDLDEALVTTVPYLAFSGPFSEKSSYHITGQLSFFNAKGSFQDIEPWFVFFTNMGSAVQGALETSISMKTKFLLETGYNFSMESPRVGAAVLFGWHTFRLKLGLGMSTPKDLDGPLVLPVINFWWRFNA